MQLSKREKTIKYLVYLLLLFAAALLQNVKGVWPQMGTARCFFLIPVALLIGLDEDERTAALLGLLAGVIWDAFSVQHMGFNAVFLMVTCFVSSALVTYLFRATYWVGVVGSVVASLIYVIAYWLLFVVARGGDGAISTIWYFYLPCFLYTAIMSLAINLVIIPIKRRLNRELRPE